MYPTFGYIYISNHLSLKTQLINFNKQHQLLLAVDVASLKELLMVIAIAGFISNSIIAATPAQATYAEY